MILASKDSLFLVNNALFFKRFGYKVINANNYTHAINNIKILSNTNDKINILVIKARSFNNDDQINLQNILNFDKDIYIIVLSDEKREDENHLQYINYYASPMEIIDNLGKN